MNKEEIFIKIQEHTADLVGIDKSEIKIDSDFRNDLGCDSLIMIELIMEFEDQFEMVIPDGEAEKLATVSSVIDYVYQSIPDA